MASISERQALLAGGLIPAIAFGIGYFTSRRFRAFARRADPLPLTLLHTGRNIGAAIFAREYLLGRIRGSYGITVTVCDVAVALSAPAMWKYAPPRMLKVWHVVGLAAIVVSAGSGILTAPTRVNRFSLWKPKQPTLVFPLVLVPSVFGPVTITAHLFALAGLAGRRQSPAPEPAPSLDVRHA